MIVLQISMLKQIVFKLKNYSTSYLMFKSEKIVPLKAFDKGKNYGWKFNYFFSDIDNKLYDVQCAIIFFNLTTFERIFNICY